MSGSADCGNFWRKQRTGISGLTLRAFWRGYVSSKLSFMYLRKRAKRGKESFQLTFEEIQEIVGIPIDHSFLKYKKEFGDYGWQVGKISMKEQTVWFHKVD